MRITSSHIISKMYCLNPIYIVMKQGFSKYIKQNILQSYQETVQFITAIYVLDHTILYLT